ncbi:hypothetical protein [Coleofasciculus sp.]|uniref:hypothetical protein n=1 Tax=Coleofasciculus sp. TaxID=3100458 RepID=UPI003A3999AB
MQALNTLALTVILGVTLTVAPFAQPVQAQPWRPVRGSILFGISGMVLLEQQEGSTSFLIVHDNKGVGEGRLAMIRVTGEQAPEYFPINWSNQPLPVDLEALTAVPGQSEPTFMALTSSGTVYHFRLNGNHQNVSVLNVFNLPNLPEGTNLEGFALQQIDDKLLAVWAHRGNNEEPGVLYWGVLDLETNEITPQGSASLTVPFPVDNVRHISDIKVDSAGVVYITSASDKGNDGPFQSAVYVVGGFSLQDNRIVFRQNQALIPIYYLNYHKVEAIELVPGTAGGIFLGTDDENMGSSIWGFDGMF